MLWEYQNKEMEPCANPPLDEYYPEVALRGVARMIPALRGYYSRAPRPLLDGGFYTKSRDNRPIVGPTSINGLFLIGALSGYGIMSACSGELLAQHISGNKLQIPMFSLNRFDDPAHLRDGIHDGRGQL
jgi:glycine/D-amino acid oxidase-like deaminating enzyme